MSVARGSYDELCKIANFIAQHEYGVTRAEIREQFGLSYSVVHERLTTLSTLWDLWEDQGTDSGNPSLFGSISRDPRRMQ